MRRVLLSMIRARIMRSPTSDPLPAVRKPASTKALPTSTGVGRAISTLAVAPGSEVEPFCTWMSAALVNSTTCQAMTCGLLA